MILWALLLILQNASFTLVSRARNSGSYLFHACAAVLANGIYIITIQIMIDFRTSDRSMLLVAGVYTMFTVLGSVAMHYISINYIEKGKRKVGA